MSVSIVYTTPVTVGVSVDFYAQVQTEIDPAWREFFHPARDTQPDWLLSAVNSAMGNQGIFKGSELWFYSHFIASKVTNCRSKLCLSVISRISNDIFGEWLSKVESGDLAHVLPIIGEGKPFLTAEDAAPLWAKMPRQV